MSQEIAVRTSPGPLDLAGALGTLVGRHGHKWRRHVERVLGNAADAEDVLQEAVRRVLLVRREFPSEDQLRMYLARAVSNTAIEFYKKRKRERRRQLPLHEQVIAHTDGANPQECMEEQERLAARERILRLAGEGLRRLPAKQYEALCMTVLAPRILSIREAGCENGIPYSTLRHRSLQGLRRLRRYVCRMLRAEGRKRRAGIIRCARPQAPRPSATAQTTGAAAAEGEGRAIPPPDLHGEAAGSHQRRCRSALSVSSSGSAASVA